MNVPTPFQYKCKQGLIKEKRNVKYLWNEKTIANILKNPVYKGDMLQAKGSILVENTHMELVKKEEFETVQQIIQENNKRVSNVK